MDAFDQEFVLRDAAETDLAKHKKAQHTYPVTAPLSTAGVPGVRKKQTVKLPSALKERANLGQRYFGSKDKPCRHCGRMFSSYTGRKIMKRHALAILQRHRVLLFRALLRRAVALLQVRKEF